MAILHKCKAKFPFWWALNLITGLAPLGNKIFLQFEF